jgi:preprotein translocase YajC subunit
MSSAQFTHFQAIIAAQAESGSGGGLPLLQIGGLVAIFVIMYLLMIRPQRKRDKQVNEMRSALKVGDDIVTIGGIRGKIINTKDDHVIIAVGSDRVKFEIMRWGISKVENASDQTKPAVKADKSESKEEDEKPVRKPRKLGSVKSTDDAEEPKR